MDNERDEQPADVAERYRQLGQPINLAAPAIGALTWTPAATDYASRPDGVSGWAGEPDNHQMPAITAYGPGGRPGSALRPAEDGEPG